MKFLNVQQRLPMVQFSRSYFMTSFYQGERNYLEIVGISNQSPESAEVNGMKTSL